ncbi:MAG: ASKHA domain-containing protein [Nitrososphaerota archaeon]|nr:ASKHA domain-containing protein [Nitrososphaerota archaeon]
MPVVIIQPEGKKVLATYGTRVIDALSEAGVNIENICGGRGVCKKCVIKVIEGELSEPTTHEYELISASQMLRLACQAKIVEDVVIKIPDSSRQLKGKILEHGHIPDFAFSPLLKTVSIRLEEPSLKDQRSDTERLINALNVRYIDIMLLKKLPRKLRELNWNVDAIIYEDEVIDVRKKTACSYGVAVDLGTTTIVAYLVSFNDGKIVSVKSDYNGQIIYGDDVISRMEYAARGSENVSKLQKAVVTTVNKLIRETVKEVGCDVSDVYEVVFSGNTVMLNLLCGIETMGIASAPFAPPFKSRLKLKAREIGIEINCSGIVSTLPIVSSYVGGDIVSDILVSGIHRSNGNFLLIDLGTNGEVVLKKGENIFAASTAAGPALEGAGLSSGMRGMEGAIESVSIDNETFEVYYRTIGGVDPIGICGSGVVDAIAWMVLTGVIDRNGRISEEVKTSRIIKVNDEKAFLLAVNSQGKRICITQSDIRSFQLAKAAIFSACITLMKIANLHPEELSKTYLFGAFGNYIDPRSAMITGMIPEVPLDKIVQMGNGSGYGAYVNLISKKAREEADEIANNVKTIELNTVKGFQNEFISATHFPHSRIELFPKVSRAIERRNPIID